MFTYVRAESLDHALETLAGAEDDLKVLAGGQSLLAMVGLGLARPSRLLDIGRLPGLDATSVEGGGVRLGALATHAHLERPSAALAEAAPLLAPAARYIGHAAIRERGTFGGSLAHGDPAAEWPAVAVALDADLVLTSVRGERRLPAREAYLGPLTTAIEPDELVTQVRWAAAPARTGATVLELAYRHGDYAVVGVAAQVSLDEDDRPREARVALFGVGGTPIRADGAEEALLAGGADALAAAGAAAAEAADPATDATASAEYRRRMVGVYTRRALATALERACRAARGPEGGDDAKVGR